MSTIEVWLAQRQAHSARLSERIAEAFRPSEKVDADKALALAVATETRDRLARDMEKWVRNGDTRMAETCQRAIDAEEKKIADLSPKADPFVVAIHLLRIAAERGLG